MARTLKELDYSVLQQCMHCGMCLPTCPTYDATLKERHSPRGRIALMRAVADEELPVTRSFGEEMSYCLGCLACQTACPAGVNYAELFETARAEVEVSGVMAKPGRSFWRWLTLRWLFLYPTAFRLFGQALRLVQKWGLDNLARRVGLTKLLPADLARLEPNTPRVSQQFSDGIIAENEAPQHPAKWNVVLLTGCIQDLAFSDVNRDTADVLLANDCHVHTPRAQGCCGSLHGHNGEPELAKILARRLLDSIPVHEVDAIISNAGGCGSHLRHFASLLHDDHEYLPRAVAWDAKLRDIHEWLVEIQCRPPQASPFKDSTETVVTYHESCHLTHGQKVVLQPVKLLQNIPGIRLVPLPESNWCCGSAGVYSITQPEQANELLLRKVNHLRSTGAAVLATANPGCHLQLVTGLKAEGLNISVTAPISLLAKAYRNERSLK